VTAIVTGFLFAAALFVAPAVGAIPSAATSPALIIVGSLVMAVVSEIEWTEAEVASPAFLTRAAIPMTFSIANGLAFGFTSYALLNILCGRFREVNWFVYVLSALFICVSSILRADKPCYFISATGCPFYPRARRGNPVKIRDCPAAVSRNERRNIALAPMELGSYGQ
jgi:hypothetical protein